MGASSTMAPEDHSFKGTKCSKMPPQWDSIGSVLRITWELKKKIPKTKPNAVLRLHSPSDILICWVGRKKFEHWHNIKTPRDAGLLCWLGLFVLSCVQFDIIAGHLGRGNLVGARDASIRVACRQASFSLTIGEGRLSPLWTIEPSPGRWSWDMQERS